MKMKWTFDYVTKMRSQRYRELFGDKAVDYFDQALCDFIKKSQTMGTATTDAAIRAAKTTEALLDRCFPKTRNTVA